AVEAAQLAQATRTGRASIIRREADAALGVVRTAALGVQYLQSLPTRLIIELQLRGTRCGVPACEQVIGVAAYEGGESRTHQRLGGRRRARAIERRLATFTRGAAGTARTQPGRHNASRFHRAGIQPARPGVSADPLT